SFIDNQLDPGTGTIRVRALVTNSTGALTPGLYARVQFAGSGKRSAILVSDRAVLTDQNRKYVYVVAPNNKATRRDVTTGRTVRGLRVIESGLGPDDRIVVGGLQKLYVTDTLVTPHMAQLRLTDDVGSVSSQDNASDH
ncbi:efflux RND transporter periplasmic adaptor subunit, partial [Bradyrhizobium sp. Pear77]|uniref:efflux RND transporter periplasmic adaptor subunit n=1 Tax=Bradyrhizobium altum TaxID=1571202 RepID=UPI001E2DB274